MEDFELEYDVQEVSLPEEHVFQITTVANEALPLEMLLDLETRKEEISGQRLWEGSLLLCSHLLKLSKTDPSAIKGRSVLELGGGTGIVSLLAHKLGATPVVVTDGDKQCSRMARTNLQQNDVPATQAVATVLRWGDALSLGRFQSELSEWLATHDVPEVRGSKSCSRSQEQSHVVRVTKEMEEKHSSPEKKSAVIKSPTHHLRKTPGHPGPKFELILAGDVLYKKELLPLFFSTVDEMMAEGGTLFLCHVPRAGVTHEMVANALDSSKWSFEAESVVLDNDGDSAVKGVPLCIDDAQRALLYQITKARYADKA